MAALTFSVGMPNLIMKRILSLFSFPPLVFSGRPFQPLVMMPSRDPWRELLRILLPRTRVNKGKKPRGRDPVEPRPATQIVDALLVTHLHCRARAHPLAHDFSPLPQRSIPVEYGANRYQAVKGRTDTGPLSGSGSPRQAH